MEPSQALLRLVDIQSLDLRSGIICNIAGGSIGEEAISLVVQSIVHLGIFIAKQIGLKG